MSVLFRHALATLIAVVLAAAPLANAVGAATSADCVAASAGSAAECCGDLSPTGACAAACTMGGSACMAPALPGAALRIRLDAPAWLPSVSPLSVASAPDTAPPKSLA
ncbi:MAG: hypothetical protein AB1452_04720 [Pseudomonadota bacterium]